MPKRNEHTEILVAGAAVSVGAVTVLPIERVVLRSRRGDGRWWFAAVKEPYALVLRDAGGIRVFDTDAIPIPIDSLRELFPRLDAALAAM